MKISAVGGYAAVGRNMTGVSVGDETVAIDNGIRLDTLQMYDGESDVLKEKSIDELISMEIIPPQNRLKNLCGQVISHGHLDHIGALPVNRPRVPIIAHHYTTELCRKEYKEGDYYSMGYNEERDITRDLSVEFVEVTHSIPYSSIVVLHTPEGDVVYASDFRFDNHSLIGKTDYKKLREIRNGNPKALVVESTRAWEEGKTPSESIVRAKLSDVMEFIDSGLVMATTFSTHIERIQAIVDEAEKSGRKILIMGRSFSKQISLAERFGVLNLPPGAQIFATGKAIKNGLKDIHKRDDYFLLVTGHQGESESVISRIADGRLGFKLKKGDSAILCANTIPTPVNVASRYILETRLKYHGVRIFDNVHVSGHAAKEDHRYLINLLKPDHIIPCHGTLEMRSNYAAVALEEGYEMNKNLHLLVNGGDIDL
jgi:ribonuclease J